MSNSLRDQLVKAGLASKQSANAQNAKSRKKRKKPPSKTQSDIEAQKAAADKREKDKALNAAIQEKQQKATIKGQIKTLIESSTLEDYRGETAYSYVSGTKIRQLFVSDKVHDDLAADKLVVTRLNGKTHLVPVAVGEKILALNPDWSVARPGKTGESEATDKNGEDDPYADYQVPDDLTW